MRLKQELVNGVYKREQLKREASEQAKAVWEKREGFARAQDSFFVTQCKERRAKSCFMIRRGSRSQTRESVCPPVFLESART